MRRPRAWLFVLLAAVLCAAAIGTVAWWRARDLTPSALLKRLPSRDAIVLYVDFAALRQAGIMQLLDGANVEREPDYAQFVEKTEFDYREDLDSALVAFAPQGKFMLLKGRFDWGRLYGYVREQGGLCYNSLCKLEGSAPDRLISFLPVQSRLMALAVSPADTGAALNMTNPPAGEGPAAPAAPVWLSIPGSALQSGQSLPEGTRVFSRAMAGAESATLSAVPEGTRFALHLELRCRRPEDAHEAGKQLTQITAALREAAAETPGGTAPNSLASVLTAGVFRSEGARVTGHWPVDRALLETLLAP